MSGSSDEVRKRLRRSIDSEFARMEDDFDVTRNHRLTLVDRLMESASKITITDEKGELRADSEDALKVITTAIKALDSVDKSTSTAISLKLRQQEIDVASAANTKERVELIIAATAPGRIRKPISTEQIGSELAEMFNEEIKDFELRSNPRDIQD